MTNRVAYWIAGVILLALIVNFAAGLDAHVFLGRRFLHLVQWMAFWR